MELTEQLQNDGFECCILKGQGNATMYLDPYARTPGDIDIWVRPKEETRSGRAIDRINKVVSYSKKRNPQGIANFIHVDYGDYGGVEVELHYWPTYMNSPIYNKRLRQWISSQEEYVLKNKKELPGEEGVITVPTDEFNIIYQLSHMYKHVFAEGIGLRQMIDYYYLLRNAKDNVRSKTEDVRETLKYLNLYKFAGAVMYVMKEVLGLDEKYLIVPIEKKRGEFLLDTILRGGNFGKYDKQGIFLGKATGLGNFLYHLERDIKIFRFFPSESIWEPVFRIYHWMWRMRYN